MEGKIILLALCLKYNNDWNRIYNALTSKEELSDDELASAKNFTGNYITMLDGDYPARLKQKYKPPFVLYYDGDVSLLKRVDEYDGKNNLIFLHGPNTFNFPSDNLCFITDDNKVSICNGLKVWFNNDSTNVDRYGLAAGLCHIIVGTKVYAEDSHSWFVGVTINNALAMGADVYMVPTAGPSFNNRLIKQGCNLIDCSADIEFRTSESHTDLPF